MNNVPGNACSFTWWRKCLPGNPLMTTWCGQWRGLRSPEPLEWQLHHTSKGHDAKQVGSDALVPSADHAKENLQLWSPGFDSVYRNWTSFASSYDALFGIAFITVSFKRIHAGLDLKHRHTCSIIEEIGLAYIILDKTWLVTRCYIISLIIEGNIIPGRLVTEHLSADQDWFCHWSWSAFCSRLAFPQTYKSCRIWSRAPSSPISRWWKVDEKKV